MKRIAIILVYVLEWSIVSTSEPTVALNKTKRTLVDTANYGEKPASLFYAIPDGTRPDFFATTKTFALAKPSYAVFDPEVPKQVAAQQVLYEYQQTPTNAVSNVHVKQLFQPLDTSDVNNPSQFNQNNPTQQQTQQQQQNLQNVHTSESVVNPVQHSSLINHGQNYAHVHFQPYFPQHTQTQHYVPGRYFYVNGKYIYPPLPTQSHHSSQSQNQFQNANTPHSANKPVNFITYGNMNSHLKQKLTPPPTGSPMNYNKFIPPQKQDIQPITKPVHTNPPKVREEVDEEEDNASVQKEDERNEESSEDDNEDKSNYEEDEDSDDHYGKYFEDEDEDHGHYKEEQEEEEEDNEDSDRKASRVVRVHKTPNRNKKNTPSKKRQNDKKNYAWSESFSHSSKYENGKKKSDKSKESKKYDTTKKKDGKKHRNKTKKGNDKIEGRYSHNIPVIQEHNIFREKWYLSKSKNERKL